MYVLTFFFILIISIYIYREININMIDNSENRTSGYEMLIEFPNATNNNNDEKNYYEIYDNNGIDGSINNNHICENNEEKNNQGVEFGNSLNYTIGDKESFGKYCYNINEKKNIETDIKYYSYFFISLIFLGFFILYYIYHGDYSRILYGTNYNGQICGKDLKSFKYLYYPLSPKTSKFEILKKYPKCLESCPTSDFSEHKTDEENFDVEKKKKIFLRISFFFPLKKIVIKIKEK